MNFPRSSGILLHPTSLPGDSASANSALRRTPLPTSSPMPDRISGKSAAWTHGYGDSPYQCFSAFAGNPCSSALIACCDHGLSGSLDLAAESSVPGRCRRLRRGHRLEAAVLQKALENFRRALPIARIRAFLHSVTLPGSTNTRSSWPSRTRTSGVSWTDGIPRLTFANQPPVQEAREQSRDDIDCDKFIQFEFEFRQWGDLKTLLHPQRHPHHGRHAHLCRSRQRRRVGQSRAVRSRRGTASRLSSPAFRPTTSAPPDSSGEIRSITGSSTRKTGYRMVDCALPRVAGACFDLVRLDHFRGFEAYWEIPAGETTAVNGAWVKGPGADLVRGAAQRRWATCRSSPKISASSRRQWRPCATSSDFPAWRSCNSPSATIPQAPDFQPHNYQPSSGRLHRHARQRHVDRLVEQQGRRGQHSHRRGCRRAKRRMPALSQHRRQRHQLGHDSRR